MRFNYAGGMLLLSMEKGGQTYYFAYDQVGSLRLITDSSGSVVKQIDYDSFGNIITETNAALKIPFGFAGGLHDRDTGLVRFGFRDYDPDTGRWTAKDPLLFDGGDTDLYGYVLNNPVNYVDPLGLTKVYIAPGHEHNHLLTDWELFLLYGEGKYKEVINEWGVDFGYKGEIGFKKGYLGLSVGGNWSHSRNELSGWVSTQFLVFSAEIGGTLGDGFYGSFNLGLEGQLGPYYIYLDLWQLGNKIHKTFIE